MIQRCKGAKFFYCIKCIETVKPATRYIEEKVFKVQSLLGKVLISK